MLEQKGLALQPAPGEWSVTLGGGIGAGPRFPGASTDRARFAPLIEVLYGKTLLRGLVSFKDIVGDAANSPIVQDRTQVVFGVGLAWHF